MTFYERPPLATSWLRPSCPTGEGKPQRMVFGVLAVLLLSGCAVPVHAKRDVNFEPWGENRLHDSTLETYKPTANGPLSATALLWFAAYKSTFSRLDGNRCNFYPSCSTFGLRAVETMGLYGALATFGRVHKNHLDSDHYSRRGLYLADPITNYTFWLRQPQRDDFSAYADPAHAWFQHVRVADAN